MSWVPIPTSYWSTVTNDKFKVIRRRTNEPSSGVYKIRLGEIAATVVAHINMDSAGKPGDIWEAIIAATAKRYEVEIKEADWTLYNTENPPSGQTDLLKGKSGRPQKAGWRDLSVIIGAYILKHSKQTQEQIKVDPASEIIHKIALARRVPDCPEAPTIKEVLSRIRDLAEEISIN